ncbi:RHS repeat-associated core domain-containing protein [Streptomyces sp. NPDC007088]|uniref:RHS repeat-associated core domain-containing protein n=1 Tax=Streptomyces sp. NPDC007088 TaxID=3364773 RepID=UPI003686537F
MAGADDHAIRTAVVGDAEYPTTGQPLSLRTTNGYEAYYIVDGIGNPVQFINQSTVQSTVYDYDPHGAVQTTKETGTAGAQNPYRFVGGTYDRTTGYVKYGQRRYDPTTGRFTTQDKYSFLANRGAGTATPMRATTRSTTLTPMEVHSWGRRPMPSERSATPWTMASWPVR